MIKKENRATITDVARATNVSVATVSCILKDPSNTRFSAETNKRVMEAVRTLNYRPASFARQMRGKALPAVSLILPSLMNSFYPEVATGFTNQANDLGYNVIYFNSDNDINKEKSFVETMISFGISGVALCGVYSEDDEEKDIVKRLINLGIPVIRIDRYESESDCPFVGIDNFGAGYCMTENLIQLGHTAITCVMPSLPVYIVKERMRGYMEAMNAHGLDAVVETFPISDPKAIHNTLERIWNSDKRPSAVFAIGGDADAIECIRSASSLGIAVPSELSVAGYDDIEISGMINPSITTIRQPKLEIGSASMRLLKNVIDGEDIKEPGILLPFEYIPRESVRNLRK